MLTEFVTNRLAAECKRRTRPDQKLNSDIWLGLRELLCGPLFTKRGFCNRLQLQYGGRRRSRSWLVTRADLFYFIGAAGDLHQAGAAEHLSVCLRGWHELWLSLSHLLLHHGYTCQGEKKFVAICSLCLRLENNMWIQPHRILLARSPAVPFELLSVVDFEIWLVCTKHV